MIIILALIFALVALVLYLRYVQERNQRWEHYNAMQEQINDNEEHYNALQEEPQTYEELLEYLKRRAEAKPVYGGVPLPSLPFHMPPTYDYDYDSTADVYRESMNRLNELSRQTAMETQRWEMELQRQQMERDEASRRSMEESHARRMEQIRREEISMAGRGVTKWDWL